MLLLSTSEEQRPITGADYNRWWQMVRRHLISQAALRGNPWAIRLQNEQRAAVLAAVREHDLEEAERLHARLWAQIP